MRFTERFRGLKEWTYHILCEGREMKAPAQNGDIAVINRQEPKVYLGWAPSMLDQTGQIRQDVSMVVPSITIMPTQSLGKYTEEKRFDRYNGIHRPQEMGQHLGVQFLFSIYEPGVRLPGFVHSAGEKGQDLDLELITEGTEQGFMTLMNWIDDGMEALVGTRIIPGTDMYVDDESLTYSLYTDQNYVVDRRPVYYGFITCTFGCYAEPGQHPELERYLI